MFKHARSAHQNGSVLVVSMVLLLVITVLALASMSNTHMQERMAGNARMQALAFEVASAGASNSLDFYIERKPGLLNHPGLCRDNPGWHPNDWPEWELITEIGGSAITRIGDHDVELRQRIYCTSEPYPDQVDADGGPVYPATAQLFVLSRGEVLNADGVAMARRDIEVRIVDQLPQPLDSCTAICLPACDADPDLLRMPTADAFQVDGQGGPAITTGSEECRDAVINATQEEKLGNYVGGVAAIENEDDTLGWPWDSENDVDEFVEFLLTLAGGESLPGMRTEFRDGSWEPKGNDIVDLGGPGDPKLTFVDGDAEFRGNDTGEGILVVTGGLEWRGTPQFTGLILVLGGDFTVKGGGSGGDFGGSLIVLNQASWGDVALDFRGGGTANYIYDCEKLQEFSKAIYQTDTPTVGSEWYPLCGGDPGQAGLTEAATVSWRENIGWRNID